MTAETVTHRATLTDHERVEYEEAGDRDREWFACRPDRQYRLRPANPSETKLLSPPAAGHARLVRKVHERCRLRFLVLWTIPGALPDDDAVLERLAAGVAFVGGGGHA